MKMVLHKKINLSWFLFKIRHNFICIDCIMYEIRWCQINTTSSLIRINSLMRKKILVLGFSAKLVFVYQLAWLFQIIIVFVRYFHRHIIFEYGIPPFFFVSRYLRFWRFQYLKILLTCNEWQLKLSILKQCFWNWKLITLLSFMMKLEKRGVNTNFEKNELYLD